MTLDKEHLEHDDNKEVTTETLTAPPLHIRPAQIRKRAAAVIIDSVTIGVACLTVISIFHLNMPTQLGFNIFLVAIVTFLYYFLFEGLMASTIGKRLFSLQVVGQQGDPVTFRESFLRNVFRFIDWLPALYVLGTVLIHVSKERRRLGDIIARTTVTPSPEKDVNPPPAPFLFH